MQVAFLEQMQDHFAKLQQRNPQLQVPTFRTVLLHVDEDTSVERQQHRAAAALRRNAAALCSPSSHAAVELELVRESDLCAAAGTRRYDLYKESLGQVLRLADCMPLHVVDAAAPLRQSRAAIARALSSPL